MVRTIYTRKEEPGISGQEWGQPRDIEVEIFLLATVIQWQALISAPFINPHLIKLQSGDSGPTAHTAREMAAKSGHVRQLSVRI